MNEHFGNIFSLRIPKITDIESGISVIIIVNMFDLCKIR